MLTLEEAKEKHRKMWDYISKQSDNKGLNSRYRLKEEFLVISGDNMWNDCYLCQYAREQTHVNDHMCEYCPVLWGSENIMGRGYCECANYDDFDPNKMIDWVESAPEKVRDVPFKDEVEKESDTK